jgi:hypothetical protein
VRRVGLDHVGVVTRNLHALAAQYEYLGFTLTPLARQADGRIGNRCAMLRESYIELLAVVDPKASSTTLDRFLARYAGVHILTFSIEDEQAELARLQRAGVTAPAAVQVERVVDDADPAGPLARFVVIHMPDQPEGRINLVRHLTPQALWQQRFLQHSNGTVALDSVTIAVPEPMDTAARFSCLIGCPVMPNTAGGVELELAHGRICIITREGDIRPRIVGMTLRTSDGNAAIGRLAVERSIDHRSEYGAVVINPAAAGGVSLRFLPESNARRS